MLKNVYYKLEENHQAGLSELFEELDLMIRKLEDGSSSLEDSFRYYEEGMKLVKACAGKIDRVEKQIVAVNDTGGEYGA